MRKIKEIINGTLHTEGVIVHNSDLPDVDIDINSRGPILKYFIQKYGASNTCNIGTIGRFKNKSILLDIARMFKIDLSEIYRITQGELTEIDDAEDLSVEELRKKSPDLNALLNLYPQMVVPFEKFRGIISNHGQHAGGVLVSDTSLTDILPVRQNGDEIVSCWTEGISGRELGMMGFVKMDILAILVMDFINNIFKEIKTQTGTILTIADIPLENNKAFAMANRFDLLNVWQMDSKLAITVIKAINGISSFEDIIACNALLRPSALKNKFHVKFGDRKIGNEEYYLPECLQPFLSETYGLPLYQEAAYHVAHNLAGFDIVKAYKFMKLLYKGKMKDPVVIEQWRDDFYKGCQIKVDNGECEKNYVETIFNELLGFQGYGFCKSHATAYGVYSAVELYLKAYYPKEYMCTVLNHTDLLKKTEDGTFLIVDRIQHAIKSNINILPIDINKSSIKWKIEEEGIRMPFKMLKKISTGAETIVEHQPYSNFKEFLDKIDNRKLNKVKIEQLIFIGAFECFNDRQSMYNTYHNVYLNPKPKTIQTSLFDFGEETEDDIERFFTNDELDGFQREYSFYCFNDDLNYKYSNILMTDRELVSMRAVENGTMKYPYVLVRVGEFSWFNNKNGVRKAKVALSDGINRAGMLVDVDSAECHKTDLATGNIIKLPVFVSDNDRCFYFLSDKKKQIEVIKYYNKGLK